VPRLLEVENPVKVTIELEEHLHRVGTLGKSPPTQAAAATTTTTTTTSAVSMNKEPVTYVDSKNMTPFDDSPDQDSLPTLMFDRSKVDTTPPSPTDSSPAVPTSVPPSQQPLLTLPSGPPSAPPSTPGSSKVPLEVPASTTTPTIPPTATPTSQRPLTPTPPPFSSANKEPAPSPTVKTTMAQESKATASTASPSALSAPPEISTPSSIAKPKNGLTFLHEEHSSVMKLPPGVASSEEARRYEEAAKRRTQASSTRKKYITYVPTDGFSNQLVSLTNGFIFAFETGRTLVLPPILGHFEGPARGNCHVEGSSGLTNQTLIQEGLNYFYHNFFECLLTFHFEQNSPPYSRRRWPMSPTTSLLQRCSISLRSQVSIYFLDSSFVDVFHNVSMGSVYFPVLKLPLVIFDWYLKTIYKDLFQVAKTFPYSKPFQHFAVGEEILKTKPSFYCVHARINEAYFLKQREGFLNATREGLLNLTQQFTKEENATRPLLLILSDAPLVDVVKGLSPEIAGFEPITRLPRFSDLVEKTQKELPAGQDLMHFEAATCVLAKKFLGHSQSTFSRRIRALRQL